MVVQKDSNHINPLTTKTKSFVLLMLLTGRKSVLIISLKPGQLGNRLEIFARIIAYARENNLTVINPSFDEYALFFKYTSTSLHCRYPHKKSLFAFLWLRKVVYLSHFYAARITTLFHLHNSLFSCINLSLSQRYDLVETGLPNSHFIWLHGWKFRVKDLCHKHKDEIRDYFTPKDIYTKNIEKHFSSLSLGYDLVIGIHIRLGDYKYFQDGKYYYAPEEYRSFMEQISLLFPRKNVRFLICSNTNQTVDTFNNFNIFFGSGHLIEDLYLLARCDYIFGPPSTFTKWASFYGNVPLGVIENRSQKLQLNHCEVAQL